MRVQALVATSVAAVREVQVWQAPHIADADDAAMTRMGKRMATSEAGARQALETLQALVPAASRPRLDTAGAALARFMDLNGQIIALSRRNTNVQALALSLNQKGELTKACEDSLRAPGGSRQAGVHRHSIASHRPCDKPFVEVRPA